MPGQARPDGHVDGGDLVLGVNEGDLSLPLGKVVHDLRGRGDGVGGKERHARLQGPAGHRIVSHDQALHFFFGSTSIAKSGQYRAQSRHWVHFPREAISSSRNSRFLTGQMVMQVEQCLQ
jgi:hypothetical protein